MKNNNKTNKQLLNDINKLNNKIAELEKYDTKRKYAEEALQKSGNKYRLLFETMEQGVVYQDANGQIISANSTAERILGLSLDQMQGRTSIDPRWKSIHEDGSDFPGETHPAMVSLETGKIVKNIIMGIFNPKFEKYNWININAIPQIKHGEKTPYQVYTTFDDITERKQTEEELRLHSEMIKNMVEGVYLIGLDDVIIKYANSKFEEMFGYEKGEMIGKHASIVNAPTDKDPTETAKKIMKIIYDTGEWHGEVNNIKKDDTPFWCYANVSKFKHSIYGDVLMAVHSDITKRKQAEQESQESHARLKALVESPRDIIIFSLDNQYRYTAFNKNHESEMKKVYNVDIEEGMNMLALINIPEVKIIVEKIFKRVLSGNSFNEIQEQPGQKIFYHFYWSPVKTDDGEIIGISCMIINETKRIMVEKKLKESQENLKLMSNRLIDVEEKERRRFAYDLHDSVGQLLAAAQIQLSGISKSSTNSKTAKSINKTRSLILDAIQESRDLTYELSPPILYELGLVAACEWHVEQFLDRHKINIQIKGDNFKNHLDIELQVFLFRIIRELINNIIKHASASLANVSIETFDDHVVLIVEDNGVGFNVSNIREKAVKCMKFGLFGIRERIDYFGGKLKLDSKKRSGTKITITVPV